MKLSKLFLLAANILLLPFTGWAQGGLVAHYPLNGIANNVLGTNDGTIVGAVATTDRFGQANGALSFNGTGNRVDFAAPPITQTTNWTISAWIRAANFSQVGIAVMVGSDNGSASDGFGFGLNGSSTLQGFTPFIGGGFFSSGQALASTGQWYHVVMLRDTGPIKMFLNGVQTSNVTTAPNFYPPSDFTIGGQNGVRYFAGAVDEVRIYNRAITTNEVVQLYNDMEFCSPHAAAALATVINGFVVGATITDGGCGYTNPPLVVIQGGGGSNATATATITNGQVVGINILNPGCCYTNAPTIIIAAPPFVPTVSIQFSKVNVIQHVRLGHNYVLEYTLNLVDWSPTGPSFTPQSETVTNEFDLGATGRYFRIREVP